MQESLVVVVRAFITFFTILIYARMIGKQQIGNFTMFDYINGITIGSIAATLATDLSSKAFVHWMALTVFIVLTIFLQYIGVKNRFLSKVQDSEPVVLMQDGKILEKNLAAARITKDELMAQLRVKNVFSPVEVEVALLEPDGSVSVRSFSGYQPVQKRDLHLPEQKNFLTTELIIDGTIIHQNLAQRNVNESWLMTQLEKRGVTSLKDVSFAAILPNDVFYLDTFEDRISDKMNVSDYPGPY
ncbi:Uncharacterized membrane protein YcaP, DUF421 family [Alteribacillus persepolensis]|uniref:Uncharacterized membrane protein YcaP, DUF421 family n=1 Tax=Alteribacillus persepolensis TaxID=568899 RepID=A0A1G7Z4B3_9BACI|nr:DUF421 domain-containing protein [Alteribacillus persepolensis]SDH02990.1 Uncharacterized membrane protein YcaP, DUF421 family [Alteribacillus persepolensis]